MKTLGPFLCQVSPTSRSNESPLMELHVSHMIRTLRSAASEANASSRRSYLRFPDQANIRPEFDIHSLETRAKAGSTRGKEDHLCCRCSQT